MRKLGGANTLVRGAELLWLEWIAILNVGPDIDLKPIVSPCRLAFQASPRASIASHTRSNSVRTSGSRLGDTLTA